MSLQLQGISKAVAGISHIHRTDLELPTGLNVLFGHTQAGKTTLLRIIAGLDKPDSGKILSQGRDLAAVPLQRRRVAMVYQQFVNYPSFTVYDNIASPLQLAGLDKNAIARRVHETAELLHLEKFLQRYPAELSGGQQQRTAIARALVKDADILLFDEPLVNLDYKLRDELRSEIKAIFARRPVTVIYATTEPGEALLLGGCTTVLDQGAVLQSGPGIEVYRRPASLRVAEVFSDPKINTVAGTMQSGRIRLASAAAFAAPSALSPLGEGDFVFGLRCGQLSMLRRSEKDIALSARVELAEVSGSETFIHVRNAQLDWIVQQEGIHSYALGQQLDFYFDPEHLFAFAQDGQLQHAPSLKAA
jgi:glycerol transport system ATP-binding protein